jgi:hypothetical protein
MAEIPLEPSSTILWLMVCLESSAALKALKLFWYHAKVLVVTLFKYRRSSMNLETGGIFDHPDCKSLIPMGR